MKMERTECSETSAYKIHTLGNSSYLPAYEYGTDSVPKRRHIKFRRREILHTYPPMKMEHTECSETSEYKIQTPGIIHTYPPINMEQSVPKRRHIKFRRRGILHTYPPMKMEQTERSETSAYKIQTPGNSYLPAYEGGTDRVF